VSPAFVPISMSTNVPIQQECRQFLPTIIIINSYRNGLKHSERSLIKLVFTSISLQGIVALGNLSDGY